MSRDYEEVKKLVMKSLKEALSSSFQEHTKGLNEFGNLLIDKAEEAGVDSEMLEKLLKRFKFFKRKKGNKKLKKVVLTLLIASFTTIILALIAKNYDKIKKGETAEEKIRIFFKSLNLDKLKNQKIIRNLRKELKKVL